MSSLKSIYLLIFLLFSGLITSAQSSDDALLHGERSTSMLAKSISVYPNPAIEFVEVNLDYLNAHKVKLTLYNIIGNQVNADTEVIDEHKIRVRVKDFAAGYYLIALRDEETNFRGTYKFLKR